MNYTITEENMERLIYAAKHGISREQILSFCTPLLESDEAAAKEYAERELEGQSVNRAVTHSRIQEYFLAGCQYSSAKSKWIPVTERLPEDRQRCIVIQNPETTATKEPLFAIFDGESKRFLDPAGTLDGIHLTLSKWVDIILWQPLPQRP